MGDPEEAAEEEEDGDDQINATDVARRATLPETVKMILREWTRCSCKSHPNNNVQLQVL